MREFLASRWAWRFYYLAISATALGLDQVSKLWIRSGFQRYDLHPVIPGIFTLTYRQNRGAAFGLFHDLPDGPRTLFFLLVPSCITLIILVWSWRTPVKPILPQLALSFVLGGAIGNFLDRLQFGYVIDFLLFHLGKNGPSWPAFNVADSFISVGVVLLLVQMFYFERKKKEKEGDGISPVES